MVGIARGRGCGTCRKRKIACDLQKPRCAQCVKSKRTCTGYRKYPIFIAHQPPKTESFDARCHHECILGSKTSRGAPLDRSAELDSTVSTPSFDDGVNPGATAPVVPLRVEVSDKPVLRQQLLHVYLTTSLSKHWLGPLEHRLWVVQIPSLPHLTPALEASMMALCLARLGEVHENKAWVHESLKLYQQALHHLQLALYDSDLMLHDQTITACVALGMYEMSQCPSKSKDAYISHTLGCQKLIQLRGPEAHVEGLGHAVFVHFRVQAILYGLDQGQQSFLGEQAWQEIPWRTRTKNPYDHIYDFLTRAPELRNQGELLASMDRDSQLRLATEMIGKCWKLDAELQSVYLCLERSVDGPVFWPELARNKLLQGESEDGMLFPVAFHFQNLAIANTALIYWAVQIILWNGMWQLYRLIEELRQHFAAACRGKDADDGTDQRINPASHLFCFPPLEYRADFAAPCRNIFQSMEYALQEDMLDQGPKCAAGPLRIAYETLRIYPNFAQEVAWAERAQELLQNRSLRLLIYYIPRR